MRRQIESAERKLVTDSTNSAPAAMNADAYLSSASPSIRANKRRHTSVPDSGTIHSTERSAKRTKTLKTYGSKHRTHSLDDGSFDRLKDDEPVPKTSQSARFTEHSGIASSVALPSGSIEEGFKNHEPHVMFNDSGSTIADNSSAEQRLLEQALGKKKHLSVSPGGNLKAGEQHDSSLPWSTSASNDAAKSSGTKGSAQNAGGVQNPDVVDGLTGDRDGFRLMHTLEDVSQSSTHAQADLLSKLDSALPRADSQPNATCSPTVEIRRNEFDTEAPAPEASASTQKARRRRKSKALEDKDPEVLISDDRPIGLPKEEYKPRPSKRRATQIVEGQIDFSVRPEKAAKAKRTKTTHAAGSQVVTDPNATHSLTSDNITVTAADPVGHAQDGGEDPLAKEPHTDTVRERVQEPVERVDGRDEPPTQETTQEDALPQPAAEQECEDDLQVKSLKSTQKTKSASRAKRAQTTIFEDHLEFASSQRALNLSQQQANRKSALQSVSNEAKSTQRKRKLVVSDDEDDEDELVKEAKEAPEEDPAPKKRGRGRPPKSTTKSQPVHIDTANDDTKNDGQSHAGELEDLTMKGGQGKPCKADKASKTVDASNGPDDSSIDHPSNEAPEKPSAEHLEVTVTMKASGASDADLSSTKLLMPSPDKQEKPKKDVKPSPTTHSPIKSNSKVPFRLGLSKRHRIPPLLRTVNPRGR